MHDVFVTILPYDWEYGIYTHQKLSSSFYDQKYFFPQEILKPLIDIALKLTKMKEYTGRDEPTVIT